MKSDFVKLSWRDAVMQTIPVDAYIIPYPDKIDPITGEAIRFSLLDPYTPEQKSEAEWVYEPQFQHPKMYLGKVLFERPSKDTKNNDITYIEWPFTGSVTTIIELITKFISDTFGLTGNNAFGYQFIDFADKVISVQFNSADVLSALTVVANACEVEWHIDYDMKMVYFGRIAYQKYPTIPLLEAGVNVGISSTKNDKTGFWNAYKPQGSKRNIMRRAASEEFVMSDVRLALDKSKYPEGIIYLDPDGNYEVSGMPITKAMFDSYGIRPYIKPLIFEEVYPKQNLYVYQVRYRELYMLDSETKKRVVAYTDADGDHYLRYAIWYVKLARPIFDDQGNVTEWIQYVLNEKVYFYYSILKNGNTLFLPTYIRNAHRKFIPTDAMVDTWVYDDWNYLEKEQEAEEYVKTLPGYRGYRSDMWDTRYDSGYTEAMETPVVYDETARKTIEATGTLRYFKDDNGQTVVKTYTFPYDVYLKHSEETFVDSDISLSTRYIVNFDDYEAQREDALAEIGDVEIINESKSIDEDYYESLECPIIYSSSNIKTTTGEGRITYMENGVEKVYSFPYYVFLKLNIVHPFDVTLQFGEVTKQAYFISSDDYDYDGFFINGYTESDLQQILSNNKGELTSGINYSAFPKADDVSVVSREVKTVDIIYSTDDVELVDGVVKIHTFMPNNLSQGFLDIGTIENGEVRYFFKISKNNMTFDAYYSIDNEYVGIITDNPQAAYREFSRALFNYTGTTFTTAGGYGQPEYREAYKVTQVIDGTEPIIAFQPNTYIKDGRSAESAPLSGLGDGDGDGHYGFKVNFLGDDDIDKVNRKSDNVEEDDTGILDWVTGQPATVDNTHFEIIFEQKEAQVIPTTKEQYITPKGDSEDNEHPSLFGNLVNMYNVVTDDDAEKAASADLENETKKYIDEQKKDYNAYTFKSNPVAFEEMFRIDEESHSDSHLFIGQKVKYKELNGKPAKDCRVQKLITHLDYDFEQEITVGNAILKGATQQLKDKVDALVNGNMGGGSGSGGQSTAALETLVKNYADSYMLSKVFNDTAQGVIKFLKGILLGNHHGITEDGDATLNDIQAANANMSGSVEVSGEVVTDDVRSRNYTGSGIGDTGFALTSDNGAGSSQAIVDYLVIRTCISDHSTYRLLSCR